MTIQIGLQVSRTVHKRRNDQDGRRTIVVTKGGPGSGHHGHKGRPGKRGGSLPGEGGKKDRYFGASDAGELQTILIKKVKAGEMTFDDAANLVDEYINSLEGVKPKDVPKRSVSDPSDIISILGLPEETSERLVALNKDEDNWLRGADPDAKTAIMGWYDSFPALKQVRLYQMWELTGREGSFDKWLDTPIELWRGGPPEFGETFASFTLSKTTAQDFADKHGGGLYSISIRPRDLIGFAPTGASEAFVPDGKGILTRVEDKHLPGQHDQDSHGNWARGGRGAKPRSKADRELKKAVEQIAGLAGDQKNWHRFVLEHGQFFKPPKTTDLPDWCDEGPAKMCFRNATMAVSGAPEGISYVEGYAASEVLPGFPFAHAWLVDSKGRVIDPTWRDDQGLSYLGVKFSRQYVLSQAVETEIAGLFGVHNIELLTEGPPPGVVKKEISIIVKHLPGQHDQKTHGNWARGLRVSTKPGGIPNDRSIRADAGRMFVGQEITIDKVNEVKNTLAKKYGLESELKDLRGRLAEWTGDDASANFLKEIESGNIPEVVRFNKAVNFQALIHKAEQDNPRLRSFEIPLSMKLYRGGVEFGGRKIWSLTDDIDVAFGFAKRYIEDNPEEGDDPWSFVTAYEVDFQDIWFDFANLDYGGRWGEGEILADLSKSKFLHTGKKHIVRLKGGPGSGHHGHKGRPGHVGGSLPDDTYISITPSEDRVWQGERHERTEDRPSKLRTGQIGEQVAMQALEEQFDAKFSDMNDGVNNAPIDVAGDHVAVEVKTGLATNGKSAQHWRSTIGQPGREERKLLKQMTSKQKREHNKWKRQQILDRKYSLLDEMTEMAGSKISARTVGIILSADGSRADVYLVPGFHLRLGWNRYATDEYLIGTYNVE